MIYKQYCPKCSELMKMIPIKKHDGALMIEYYCEKCNESVTFYPDRDQFRKGRPQFY